MEHEGEVEHDESSQQGPATHPHGPCQQPGTKPEEEQKGQVGEAEEGSGSTEGAKARYEGSAGQGRVHAAVRELPNQDSRALHERGLGVLGEYRNAVGRVEIVVIVGRPPIAAEICGVISGSARPSGGLAEAAGRGARSGVL